MKNLDSADFHKVNILVTIIQSKEHTLPGPCMASYIHFKILYPSPTVFTYNTID